MKLNVPQEDITVGVAAYREPRYVTLPKILEMPIVEQRPPDRFASGQRPVRMTLAANSTSLPA